MEDDAVSQALITDLLEDDDFSVTVASDGLQAQRMLLDHEFGAVISDLFMPNLDGIGLIEWILNKVNGDIPVYVLTGSAQPEVKDRLEVLSVTHIYYKPLSTEGVNHLINELNSLFK